MPHRRRGRSLSGRGWRVVGGGGRGVILIFCASPLLDTRIVGGHGGSPCCRFQPNNMWLGLGGEQRGLLLGVVVIRKAGSPVPELHRRP